MKKWKQWTVRGRPHRDPEARKDSSEDEHQDKQQTQGTTDTFITGDKSNLASLTWINTHIGPPHRTAEISQRTARTTNQGKKTMGAPSLIRPRHTFLTFPSTVTSERHNQFPSLSSSPACFYAGRRGYQAADVIHSVYFESVYKYCHKRHGRLDSLSSSSASFGGGIWSYSQRLFLFFVYEMLRET